MSLTQDAVIKLILNHIGGTKIKGLGPKTLVAQGREVIVKALPYKNLVAKLRELAGNLDVRDVFLQNPLAETIISAENRLSSLRNAVESLTSLPSEIRTQLTSAIDDAMSTVENMALHSSILSGTDIPNAFSGIEQSIEDAAAASEAAQTAASSAQTSATAAQAAATQAITLYSQLGDDGILSAVEKRQVVQQYTAILGEQAAIDARATSYGITIEKIAYDDAIADLTTYLGTLTSPVDWDDTTSYTNIVNFDWQSTWAAVFSARATVLTKIDEVAGTTSTWDGVTGAGRPEDGATRNSPRGEWAAATVYAVGDMVSYQGSSYVVNTAHTSTGSFDVTKFYLLSSAGSDGLDGINVATVFLYKRAPSTPAVPSTSSTFTFATGVLTGHDNGWTQTVPSGTDPLYVITATAASSGATDTILTSEWAAPNIMAQDGTDGDPGSNGLNSAVVYLYKRSATAPAVPSTTSTYTFATGALTGHDNGWTQTVPTSDGNPLYVTLASASSTGTTDTIATGEWTAPQIMAKDGIDGDPGADGLNVATIYLYKRATSTPAVPTTTSTFTFATGVLTGHDNGWTQTVPGGSDPVYVITATAASASATDTIPTSEWSSPNILAQDGSNGLNIATVYLYKRGLSAPAVPTTTSTFTFATNTLTGHDNGWTQTIPATNGQPLYVIIASAASASATDTIATGEWTTPQIMVQDGDHGADGSNNALVYIYQRGTSAPTLPSATVTYTFTTGGMTGLNNGWSATIPAGTDPLYVAVATASSLTATDTIAAGEWSTPQILTENGISSAIVILYKRSATTPTVPSTTSTYTFATGVLSGHDNGWTQAVPGGSDPLYATSAAAASTAATDTIPTGEWSAPTIVAQSGNTVETRYKRSLATPATPTGDTPSGWSLSIPSGKETLWTSFVTKNASGTAISAWSIPVAITNAFRDAYNASTTYYINNDVTYNGGMYRALQDNFSGQAPSGTNNNNAYWAVIAAPGEAGAPGTPPSAFNATINLTSGAAVNLRTVANANGYTGASDATVTFKVPNAVVCRGLSGAGLGIDSGTWPIGSYSISVALVVESGGIVDGGGGIGGQGGTYPDGGGPASGGGDAIYCRLPMTITINSGGTVRAGSGGFNGGTATNAGGGGPFTDYYNGGAGGNGGFPNGAGGTGGLGTLVDNEGYVVDYAPAYNGASGSTGTTAGTPAANNHATAGYAVRKNGYTVTVTNNGTMNGTAA